MTLKEYLETINQTAAEFAKSLGITPQAVSNYTLGLRIPSPEVMKKIQALSGGQVSIESFYNNQVDRNNPKTCPEAGEAAV